MENNALIVRKSNKNNNRTNTIIPNGIHDARCIAVKHQGTRQAKNGKEYPIGDIKWQLRKRSPEGEPITVKRRYNLTLNEKSALFRDLSTWLGEFNTYEFDLQKLIGMDCRVQTEQVQKPQGPYTNVVGVFPLSENSTQTEETKQQINDDDDIDWSF